MIIIKVSLLAVAVLFLTSCSEKTTISSIDKSEKITIIKKGEILYIINGATKSVPDTNYIKLRMTSVDLGSEIAVCWKPEKFEWDLIADNTEVLKNKLDTTRFKFRTEFPLDERGIPTPIKYNTGENCGSYSTYSGKVYRNRGIIVE